MTKDRKKHDAPSAEPQAASEQDQATARQGCAEGGAGSASAPPPSADGSSERVAAVEDRLLRLQADFDNYRKRVAREREDVWRQARADVIGDFLTVLDHVDMAIASAERCGAPAALLDGFRMVQDEFLRSLQKSGLKDVQAVGQAFDPANHEAVAHVHSVDLAENSVIAQTRRGFRLGDRLLRPAQVVVSKGPEGGSAGEAPGKGGEQTPSEGA